MTTETTTLGDDWIVWQQGYDGVATRQTNPYVYGTDDWYAWNHGQQTRLDEILE